MSLLRRYRTMDERLDTTRAIGEGAFAAPYMTRAYERSGVLRRFTRLSRYFIV